MAVFVDGVGISAGCPGTVRTNVNTMMRGDVNFTLVNNGGEEALVNVDIELVDTVGHREAFSSTFHRVPPGSSTREDHTLVLNASYQEPGHVSVTMHLRVSGAATAHQFAECDFFVSG